MTRGSHSRRDGLRGIFLMEFRARQNERVAVNPSPSTTPPQSQR